MHDLDDTDREILRLLLADARRPYADIAEHVDLSPPAVSDRVDRLRELGVIRGFTVDVDRSLIDEGVDVLVEVRVHPKAKDAARGGLRNLRGVEHILETADGRLLCTARLPDEDVTRHVESVIEMRNVDEFEVHLLADQEWRPGIEEAQLRLECAECGNTVTSEGVESTFRGDTYRFCCTSCQARFEERFSDLEEGA